MEGVIREVPAAPGMAVGLARVLRPPGDAQARTILPEAREAGAKKAAEATRGAAQQLAKLRSAH